MEFVVDKISIKLQLPIYEEIMSWSDILFPKNPKRRQNVLRLCTKLVTLLESNFKKTNEFIDCIHSNIPGRTFAKIRVDHDKTLRENSEVITKRLQEINAFLEQRWERVIETIDPAIYRQLTSPDMSFGAKLNIARKLSETTIRLAGTVTGIVILGWIRQGTFLVTLTTRLGTLATCCLASLAIGLLCVGAELLVSAIMGAIEKSKLEEAIMDLEATLDSFEPVSDDFNRQIERLIIRIEG